MKTFRFLLLLVSAQIIVVCSAIAQEIVVDRMSASEESANTTQYPYLDKQLRLSIDLGYAHRIAKMAEGIPSDFAGKMRSGYAFGGDILYFPVQSWGIGAAFNGRIFNAKMSNIEDKAQMYYIAAMGVWRKFDRNNKNALVIGSSIGYLMFKDTFTTKFSATTGANSISISNGGLGTSFEIGYDIRIGERSFIGIKLSVMAGNIKIDTMDSEYDGEDTSSVNATVGFRF